MTARCAKRRWLAALLAAVALHAQQPTREALIEKEREQKAARLQPERVSNWEERIRLINEKKIPQRLSYGYNGLRAKTGGMITQGGFGIGPEYFREDLLGGRLETQLSFQISTRAYQRGVFRLRSRNLAGGRIEAEMLSMHHYYPKIQYYGPGPDSQKSPRSNFLLEDNSLDFSLGLSPARGLLLGPSAGLLWINTGPGRDRRFISADALYSPEQVPGIDRQTNFRRYGAFLRFNTLDNAEGPRAGGFYLFQFNRYDDRRYSAYGFHLYEADLRQYVPFFNQRRVIALRARTLLTGANAGETVPFYLQPWLGGSDDLRGFRPFRFRDRNSLLFNAEYRWEIFAGLDMALFADAGKVFPRRGQLNFSRLEKSGGFGFRANVRNRTFLRLDFAFSREGFQAWFKFNDIFPSRPLGTSSTQPYQ